MAPKPQQQDKYMMNPDLAEQDVRPPPAAPVVPQPITRNQKHPRFEDLIKEDPVNTQKVSDLFQALKSNEIP